MENDDNLEYTIETTKFTPPEEPGTKILSQEIVHGVWLQYEEFEDGQSHWCTYRKSGDRWFTSSFKERPEIPPRITLTQAWAFYEDFLNQNLVNIPYEKVREFQDVLGNFVDTLGPEVDVFKEKASKLMSAREKAVENYYTDTHRKLLSKYLSGEKLAKGEREEFDRTSDILLGRH